MRALLYDPTKYIVKSACACQPEFVPSLGDVARGLERDAGRRNTKRFNELLVHEPRPEQNVSQR